MLPQSKAFFDKTVRILLSGLLLVLLAVIALTVIKAASAAPGSSELTHPAAQGSNPDFTVVKSDALLVDNDSDDRADPGDAIAYTIVITNTGAAAATDVIFTDTIDANTTLVSGSLKASPVAVDDTYPQTLVGNVSIDSSLISYSILDDDFLGLNPTAMITAFDATSTQGGDVDVNADGTFTYNPPPGFEGTDTFSYTISSANGSDTGTVSLLISGMVWFVNNNAAACTTLAAGCGRLSNPFSSLGAFNTLNNGTGNNPAANDNVFIYESGAAYTGGVTLLSGQRLIGHDATQTLAVISGLTTPSSSPSFPTMNTGGSATTIQNGSGNAVTLNQNNTVRGLTISGTSGAGIIGTGTNTLTVGSDVSVTGVSGAGLDLSGTASGTVAFGATVSNTSGRAISIQNRTGGAVSLTGAISDSGGMGVLLNNNTGATITFSGGLSLSTGANTAFTATGGGTVSVCDENPCNPAATGALINTLTTTTATALNVTNTSIGTNNLEFRSVSSNGAPTGMTLSNTGSSGGLTVKGTGAAGTGGVIQNSTGNGISLSSTAHVNLSYMNIQASGDDGINGANVTNFSLSNASVLNNGNSTVDEGIEFDNLLGTSSIVDTNVTGNAHNNVHLDNTSGTLASLTVTDSSFSANDSTIGNHGFLFEARQTALISEVTISDSTFSNNWSMGLQVVTADTATISSFIVSNNVFSDTGTGNSQEIGADFSKAQLSNLTYQFLNNTLTGHNSHAFNTFTAAGGGTGGTLYGTIQDNTIGSVGVASSGSAIGNGIRININGDADATLLVDSNTIRQTPNGRGIEAIVRNGTGGLDVTVNNNDVNPNDTSGFPLAAIMLQSNCVTICNTLRADVRGNTVPSGTTSDLLPTYIAVVESSTSTCQVVDNAPAPSADATTELTEAHTNPAHNNTGSASASPGCALISGPISMASVSATSHILHQNGVQTNKTVERQAASADFNPVSAANLPAWSASNFLNNHAGKSTRPQTYASVNFSPPSLPMFSGENINVTIGTLPAGKTLTIVFHVTVDNPFPPDSWQMCNQSTILSNELPPVVSDDPDTGAANDPTCTALDLEADLILTSSESIDPVIPGSAIGNLTYLISVTNQGPDPVTDVTVNQDLLLPAGVSFDGATPSAGSYVSPTWTIPTLLVGATEQLTFTLTVGPGAPAGADLIAATASITGANATLLNTGDDSGGESTSIDDETRCGLSAGAYTFNQTTRPVTMTVNTQGALDCITISPTEGDHPNATTTIAASSDLYWSISSTGSGFDVHVTFPAETVTGDPANHKSCRTDNNGAAWDCQPDSDGNPNTITRQNVTSFSDWQHCGGCSPTSVTLQQIAVQGQVHAAIWLLLVIPLAGITLLSLRRLN